MVVHPRGGLTCSSAACASASRGSKRRAMASASLRDLIAKYPAVSFQPLGLGERSRWNIDDPRLTNTAADIGVGDHEADAPGRDSGAAEIRKRPAVDVEFDESKIRIHTRKVRNSKDGEVTFHKVWRILDCHGGKNVHLVQLTEKSFETTAQAAIAAGCLLRKARCGWTKEALQQCKAELMAEESD